MSADLLETIHPAVPVTWWWWVVFAGLVVLAAALLTLGITRWRSLRRETPPAADRSLDLVRQETLSLVDEAMAAAEPTERARLIGRAVRRFAGLALDSDADYQTAGQLRLAAVKDPRLIRVSGLADEVDHLAYGEPDAAAVDGLAARVREAVTTWR
ncbi:hypothetical protein [Tessaracoccus palaemonis]|uniref:DUF4129 domain-containing protein n=1 Tax=Tessaracoccus palaemonis TaxID=2829499 RepID=A0ABX8SL59_9ACTN|nr:hypothetical protein [Tessaracoccus palaemonis]QXT63604.1 hypothetical protein KDB89_03765 [Tessaracoccus palaemonis]